ncbi:hypoxia-inducible factor 1-alpha inhibitor-like [Paramacrobiotus metropolitanus]|uniref:hypoxia-inducible factor 1-alpha inhibitor-like n=1 Tax=Paramacrobiotus metropolitanus TaxID=2943436 RepID=UPI002445EC08|nr:hypoxia-inducible factor 1-alpha inhibitor-like [Paramacrobiotus metropolitanus]
MSIDTVDGLSLQSFNALETSEEVFRCQNADFVWMQNIRNEIPVVLQHAALLNSASKWSLGYLSANIHRKVLFSLNLSHGDCAQLADETKIPNLHRPAKFRPCTRKIFLNFAEAREILLGSRLIKERILLDEPLREEYGANIQADMRNFDWPFLNSVRSFCVWGNLIQVNLVIGTEGSCTQAKFEEHHMLLAVISGSVRVTLFSPDNYSTLYPYPIYHPYDRYSQVDFAHPDLIKYPNFRRAYAEQATLGPNDILFIPAFWWYRLDFVGEKQTGLTMSVTFAYKYGSGKKVRFPLSAAHKVEIMRNTEKMLTQIVNKPHDVGDLLKALTLGRFD